MPFFSHILELSLESGVRWEDLSDDIREGLHTLLVDQIVNSGQSSVDWEIVDHLKKGSLPQVIQLNIKVAFLVCKNKL